jgi:hypothetical protein
MIEKKKALKNPLITKKDIQKLEEQVKIIKVETRTFGNKLNALKNNLWFERENLKDKLEDKMTLLRDDVATMKDEIITELKTMREEQEVHQGVHDRQQENLDNHEQRITLLEQL